MSKELDYIADLERENRLLGERCNQLLKDKGELTDQIADIKANCDLAIEGRDIKIKELELELTVEKDLHQEETNLHIHAEDYIKSLEQQIEKMRNCGNCNGIIEGGIRTKKCNICMSGKDLSQWELKDV